MDAVETGKAAKVAGWLVVGMTVAAVHAPGVAGATPQIESTRLGDAVLGKQIELRMRATDPQAPVTGMVVGFGRGQSGFGLSSCLPPDSEGRPFGPDAAPGGQTTLSAPHVFTVAGVHDLAARITSAGCTGGQPSTLQRLRVDVVRPGSQPRPVQVPAPELLPLGVRVPELPGLGRLPLSRADMPLPAVPLTGVPGAGVSAGCSGAYRGFRRTAQGEQAARTALLCLLNVERRRRGLRPVRNNQRLTRAAQGHSRSMVTRRFFAHVGPGALNLVGRLRLARYIPRRGGTWLVGENIGFGSGRMSRPANMHSAWMHSTPHRAAILDPRFREVGFGIFPGNPYRSRGATFTVDFGKRR
jgi:uncharacterized protein YkwD